MGAHTGRAAFLQVAFRMIVCQLDIAVDLTSWTGFTCEMDRKADKFIGILGHVDLYTMSA
jgi:hypothetical protein